MNQPSVLDYLSFEPTASPGDSNMLETNRRGHQPRLQGVLWKRRDLFKNHWRPRWFVLHREQHLLTYYLLSSNPRLETRNRSSSPESSIDYDVVPRGTIFLLGSSVERNSVLTNPAEDLYVITITDREKNTYVHLAARSVVAREKWIQKLHAVCQPESSSSTNSSHHSSISSPRTNTSTTLSLPNGTRETIKELLRPYLSSNPNFNQVKASEPYFSSNIQAKLEKVLKAMNWERIKSPEAFQENLSSAMIQTGESISPEILKSLKNIVHLTCFPSNSSKWTTIPNKRLEENLPPGMIATMDTLLETHLPYVEQIEHPDLIFKFERDGIHCSFHKTQNLIRSIRFVQGHHPLDYLKLLWTMERDIELEANVTNLEPLHEYNPHTTVVYKAYQAVWPTGPREFCSAAHWRLMKKDNDPNSLALCLLAFSCPEADELRREVAPKHVRGHLGISLQIWQQTPKGCIHTRILSYDLKGKIPGTIIQSVLTQQGDLPRIMDAHLQKIKGRASYEKIPAGITLQDYDSIYTLLDDNNAAASKVGQVPEMNGDEGTLVNDSNGSHRTSSRNQPPSIALESIVLLFPILVHRLLAMSTILKSWHAPFVIVSILFCVRWVIIEYLLCFSILLPNSEVPIEAPKESTRCHLTVDLRGVEKFLSAKQGENGEAETHEADYMHIVIRAVSRAMSKNSALFARAFLLLPPVYSTDIILHNQSKIGHKSELWIPPEKHHSIEAIATYCSSVNKVYPNMLQRMILGPSCRLLMLPENDHEIQMEWKTNDCPLNIVVSPHLKSDRKYIRPRRHLGITMTFQSSDVALCHSFAEQVQQLIQLPEMCDE